MDPRVEIRSIGAAKRLKANASWSINTAAVRGQTLIADGVAKLLGRTLRKFYRSGKKVCLAQVVGIVCGGDESSRANIQERGGNACLKTTLFCGCQRDGLDYAGRREIANGLRTVI